MLTGNDPDKAEALAANARALTLEMTWFESVLSARLDAFLPQKNMPDISEPLMMPEKKKGFFSQLFGRRLLPGDTDEEALQELPASFSEKTGVETPDWSNDSSYYAQFVRDNELLPEDRLVVMLALAPHIQPRLLNRFFKKDAETGLGDLRFGGIQGNQHAGFLPTVETALFLLAGNNLDQRLLDEHIFHPDAVLIKRNVVMLFPSPPGEPFEASQIGLSDDALALLTKGAIWQPRFSMDFPAKPLTSPLTWKDLILNDETSRQLEFIRQWLSNRSSYQSRYSDLHALKPGFKALFYGPPGTGKTMAAALLGQQHSLEVYRIDLSMVVSKYIGETEKNLEKVFSRAEGKDWILFFDEADALFGKRTNVSDAHDRYANQEISYLLQRLEDYRGLVILASNMQQNIDEAFMRRMQAIVRFPRPSVPERRRLWKNALSIAGLDETCGTFAADLAKRYDLTGAGIMNAIHYAALQNMPGPEEAEKEEAWVNIKKPETAMKHLFEGIRKEYIKEGKTF